jgi:hypothetical protein
MQVFLIVNTLNVNWIFFSEPRHLNLLQEINYSKLKNTLDKLIFLLVTFIIFISDINVSFVIIIIVLFQNQKIE